MKQIYPKGELCDKEHVAGSCGCGSFEKYAKDLLGDVNDWSPIYEDSWRSEYDIHHCLCHEKIQYMFVIKHKYKSIYTIVGSNCIKRFSNETIEAIPFVEDIGNNNHKIIMKVIKEEGLISKTSYIVNKTKQYVNKHYKKDFMRSVKTFLPVLEYFCGLWDETDMKKIISFNIWYKKYKNTNIVSNKLTKYHNIATKSVYKLIKYNSSKLIWLINNKTEKINKKAIEAYQQFLTSIDCQSSLLDDFIYTNKKNNKYTFVQMKTTLLNAIKIYIIKNDTDKIKLFKTYDKQNNYILFNAIRCYNTNELFADYCCSDIDYEYLRDLKKMINYI